MSSRSSSCSSSSCSCGITAIQAELNGQTRTSESNDFSFVANPPISLPKKVGILNLTAVLQVGTCSKKIRWSINRNPDDVLTGPLPILTPNPVYPELATLETNAEGSFNVVAFCDDNENGTLDEGEVFIVLNVALIRITLLQGNQRTVITSNDQFSFKELPGSCQILSGSQSDAAKTAIGFSPAILLEGGGFDKRLGIGSLAVPKIHVGWINNANGLSFVAFYRPGLHVMTAICRTLPILDTSKPNPGTGGSSAFMPGDELNQVELPSGGKSEDVVAADSPVASFPTFFPLGPGPLPDPLPAYATSGSFDFINYLSAYSIDFDASYAVSGQVIWSVVFKYVKNGGWQNNGSAVVGPLQVDTNGYPKPASEAGAVTTGPYVFNNSLEQIFA